MKRTRHDKNGKTKKRRPRSGSKTAPEFCLSHRIGRSTFYDLCKRGLGPRIMRVGRAVRISFEAERDWIKQMEAPVTTPVPALADVTLERSDETDASEQDHESEPSDKVIPRKRPSKRRKARQRRHQKHRHGRTEHRDHGSRRYDAKPEHGEESEEAAASEPPTRRKSTHDRKRAAHGHHRRDE